jgi:ABC-type glycerol-3-phosphate transport system substrate-binding protein
VKATFAEWAKLGQGYITANHAAIDWQDAAADLSQGKAANYLMGNFAVATFKDGGMNQRARWASCSSRKSPPGHPSRRRSSDGHVPHPVGRQEQGRREEVPRLPRFCRSPDEDERDARAAAGHQ